MAHILVVDDTEIVRSALVLALRRMGHDTESTGCPLSALELAKARPPDLALLDVCMPGMDGIALLRELRAALGDRCPTVLLVSAALPEALDQTTLDHVAGYVRKP